MDWNVDDFLNDGIDHLVLFVVSTYGEGEPPDNAREFWDWLHLDSHPTNLLSNLQYAIFGLGNRQYKIYQATARDLDKRLQSLGAKCIFPRGEGDADSTLEEDWEDWTSKLLPMLGQTYNPGGIQEEKIEKQFELVIYTPQQLASGLTVAFRLSTLPRGISSPFELAFPDPSLSNDGTPNQKFPFMAKVIVNRELLNSTLTDRSTRHIEFDIQSVNIKYEAGDHLGVFAANSESRIRAYSQQLRLTEEQMNQVIQLRGIERRNLLLPKKMTLKTLFKYFLDLSSAPRKQFLKGMALYASDPAERQRLELLGSNSDEGKEAFKDFVRHNGLTPLDILQQFPSLNPPLDHFIELMTMIKPRYYSIASSSRLYSNSIHIVVAVMDFECPSGRISHGLCSNFLCGLNEGEYAPIFVRKSKFHLPEDSLKSVIMVGPGTGLAPFVGFVQQKQAMRSQSLDSNQFGEMHLYFGCRRRTEDYIYAEELQQAESEGVLTGLHVAFSREQQDGSKVYVQHLLQRNAATVWDCLKRSGYIYVCGDAKHMAKDVDRQLVEICAQEGGMSIEQAGQFVEQLMSDGHYLRDVWSAQPQ